jgi:hypothetical protein
MAKGIIVKWRPHMEGYALAWEEAWSDELDALGLDASEAVCFFFDDCDDYEFAVQMKDGTYWTSSGIMQRDGNTLQTYGG